MLRTSLSLSSMKNETQNYKVLWEPVQSTTQTL